ncbi:MAG: hypothetical protein NC038_08330 [Paludibacter sp.]|nr:hypothetical protein [Bacteroidales bacterium]MCM1069689.1 hypothetical protein [Prevotella sp.]MCM1354403.1 hypothetical protein [Bacteroides sp.]MCM1441950.1 hypothetical protein [Muribaculum sp.]MCM1482624.1 hypothetical protein [Paludibacter sp.]
MKHNFFRLCTLALTLSLISCHEKASQTFVFLSMPSSYDATVDHIPSISVWADGIENEEFVFHSTDEDGRLIYTSKQPHTETLQGNLFVVAPYAADLHFDGESSLLTQPALQAQGTGVVFAGTKTVATGETAQISMRTLTSKITFQCNNIPNGNILQSVTLRLVPQAGASSNLFHTEASYAAQTTKLTFADAYQRAALTAYSTTALTSGSTLYLGFFPENYSNCTLQAEVIAHDNTPTGTLHVFTFAGRSFARAQNYEYILDFAQEHATYAAYPTDLNGYVSGGIPVTSGDITFAPVNLGQDEVLFPFGTLFLQSDLTKGSAYAESAPSSPYINDLGSSNLVSIPAGWRLPTEAEMQALISHPHSEGYTRGLTYGWWCGASATDTPANGGNVYLEATGYITPDGIATQRLNEGRYWIDTPNTALIITDNNATINQAEGCACAVRLVKE